MKKIFLYSFLLWINVTLIVSICCAQDQYDSDSTNCSYPISWLRTHCYECSSLEAANTCVVDTFYFLEESVNHRYYCAIYKQSRADYLHPRDSSGNASFNYQEVRIFEIANDSNTLKSIFGWGSFDDYFMLEEPTIVKNKHGTFLHLFITSGNGVWDMGPYYILRGNSWEEVKVPNWEVSLKPKTPKGHWFCRGSRINLETMTITFDVFKRNDACCCPTGGSITAQLDLHEHKFLIRNMNYSSH